MNRREPHPLSARVICKYDNRVDLNQIKSGGTAVYYENITVLTSLIDSSGFFSLYERRKEICYEIDNRIKLCQRIV
jgi:hypothetical protein